MLRLDTNEVHVWHANPEEVTGPRQTRCHDLLSGPERARWQRLVRPLDRQEYLIAKALVRTTLSRYATIDPRGWTFDVGSHGKPRISNAVRTPPLEFSLSHTPGLVALAVTSVGEVGLDVECVRETPDDLAIARRYFARLEADRLEALPPAERRRRFLEYWTLKEAYVKATGQGLSADLQQFWFPAISPPAIAFATPSVGDASQWECTQIDLSAAHVAALAIRTRCGPPRVAVRRACL